VDFGLSLTFPKPNESLSHIAYHHISSHTEKWAISSPRCISVYPHPKSDPAAVEAACSVSSFGFGGTNGHVVLASPASPEQKAGPECVKTWVILITGLV
jgi:hypothetical protein